MAQPFAMPNDAPNVSDTSRIETFTQKEFVAAGTPRPMARAHLHLDVEINVLVAGSVRYSFRGRQIELAAPCLAAFWAAVPHRLVACSEDARCVWVTLPVARLARWELPFGALDRLLAGEMLLGDGPPAAVALGWAGDEAPAARRARGHEVQAALLRVCSPATHAPQGEDAVARMARFIGENLSRPLSVTEIAGAAGYHPTAAMRLFRRATGLTIGEHLAGERLALAQRLLLTGDLPVAAVAARCGYGSVGRFHAAFRRGVGVTPGVFRRG